MALTTSEATKVVISRHREQVIDVHVFGAQLDYIQQARIIENID